MKTILIATDFSEASRNASIYGVELAKELNARIILFNAFTIPKPKSPLHVSPYRFEVEMETNNRLLDQSFFLDHRHRLIETICEEGIAKDAIIKVANEQNADFIIAGMKGEGLAPTFGSTASALVKKTNIPLVIVPEKAFFETPDIMVFASDISDVSKNMSEPLKAIANFFTSKLYMSNVVKNKDKACYELADAGQNVRKVIKVLDTSSYQYAGEGDLIYAINEFIEKNYAEMLVMLPHKDGWLERFCGKNELNGVTDYIQIPLLILPERQYQKNYSGLTRSSDLRKQLSEPVI